MMQEKGKQNGGNAMKTGKTKKLRKIEKRK
jgi:hypothetical protein